MITIDVDALAAAIAERLPETQGSQWMSIAQLAEHLGVSDKWIRHRLAEIPHARVDGKLFFDRHAVDAWLTNQTRRSA